MNKMQLAAGCLGVWLAGHAWAGAVNPGEIVATHNLWRAEVGVGKLTYSNELAASAQAWAERLKAERNCNMQHSQGKTGENLYWASAWSNGPAQDVKSPDVVNAWAEEKRNYDYSNNRCTPGQVCGHYTQVVWRDTKEVGCGMAVCDSPKNQVWVCQYLPAGNWVGQKPY